MTDPSDPPPFRHPAVYRTVRGLALSGSRTLPAAGSHSGNSPPDAPLRVSAVLRARPAREPEPDDAVGLYDARRYSEPND
jgi:hypothetical protein